MDRHFLEFWGNFLINAAKGQKQLEDMAKWIQQGLKGFDDISAAFRKFYGLDSSSKESPEYLRIWKKAEEDFRKSFQDYLNLFGVVPRQEHMALVKDYEELKKKAVDQEETIRHLRRLLEEKGADQAAVVKVYQDLMKKQTDQFQKLLEGLGQSFKKNPPSLKGGNPGPLA